MRFVLLLAAAALAAHVLAGPWLAAAVVVFALWNAARRAAAGTDTAAGPVTMGQGAARGALAFVLAWGAAWAWTWSAAPEATPRLLGTVGGVVGGMPGAVVVAASLALAAVVGALAGAFGAGLAALRRVRPTGAASVA